MTSQTLQTSKLKIVLARGYSGPTEDLRFSVKVLKQYSENAFLIADKSGLCELTLDDPKPLHRLLILKGNCVKIVNPKIYKVYDQIAIHGGSSVFQMKELRNVKIPKSLFDKDKNLKSSETVKDDSTKSEMSVCDGCQEELDRNALLRHISHKKKCKAAYGDRYNEMLAKSKKVIQKVKYSKNASKICKVKKARYMENRSEILQNARKNYVERKPVISTRRKQRLKQKNEIEDQKIKERLEDEKHYRKPHQKPKAMANSLLPYRIVKEVNGKITVDKEQAVCEGCEMFMPIEGFLKHVDKVRNCKDFYKDRLDEMRKERRKQVKQKNYKKYEEVKKAEKKAKDEESKQKSLQSLLKAFDKIKEKLPKQAKELNEKGKEDVKRSLEAIQYLRKTGTLNDETKKRLTNIESKIEMLYSKNHEGILNGIEKIKDLKCEPYPCDIKTGHWWKDKSTDTIWKIFGPDIDPMFIRKRWSNLREKAYESIRRIYLELEVECYFCKPNPEIGCLGCRMERGKNKVNKLQARESSPELKENENYIRKRKPIDFSMKDLEKDAEDDQGENYEPPKPKRGGIMKFVFPSIRES